MNGIKYLLDTNALILFFQGNPKLKFISFTPSLGISIISIIEFLSFTDLNKADKDLLYDFIAKIEVAELKKDDNLLINTITEIRAIYRLKLPDAIIAGTAIYNNAVLITNDKAFSKIPSLKIATF